MINFRTYCLLLLFTILSLQNVLQIQGGEKNTLTSKEDLSDMNLTEDTEKTHEEKKKRDLPQKLQEKVISILNPVPIVDTITEEEKYGNTGDKFHRFGRGIVTGVETIGNLINKAISVPTEAVKKLSRSTTEALNNLGGKLVGLQ